MTWQALMNPHLFTPFGALRTVQAALDALREDERTAPVRTFMVPLALYTREDGCLLRAVVPGVSAEDLSIRIEGDTLTLEGTWPELPEAEAEAGPRHLERPRGRFLRSLRLPHEVETEAVEARLERGILEIRIPRAKSSLPVKIPVRTPSSAN